MTALTVIGLLLGLMALCWTAPTWAVEPEHNSEINQLRDSGADSAAAPGTESVQAAEPEEAPPGVWDYLFSGRLLAFLLVAAAGLLLLLTRWVNRWVRIGMMLLAFVLFGMEIVFPMHPSPMCAITKLFMFKILFGSFIAIFLAMFLAILVPSLIGRKLFCGWVCPLGALQELVNKVPFKFKWKQFNFNAFNAVRFMLLIMFLLTFFAVKSQILTLGTELGADTAGGLWTMYSGYSLYDPINYFEFLHWQIDLRLIIMMVILVVASLFIYRPFCYGACPIGALTWLAEKIAPGQIRVDKAKCTECGICEEESPCPTIRPLRLANTKILPDCTSCGECIRSCPEKAISFKFKS
ncbi:MAG: 4Fe-4S binding protein [candidate division Zixibacteria bacterium]|nr:4Fe-4S binding protein [candidate division Zixibacteria bacterium]